MTTTIAQSPNERHNQTQAKQSHARKLKSNRFIGGGNSDGGCQCRGDLSCQSTECDEVTERVYRCIAVYVNVLSKVMGGGAPSGALGLSEVSKLSEFWLRSMSLCLSCEGDKPMDTMVSKIESLLLPTQDATDLLQSLLRAVLLQASLLAAIGDREKLGSMEPPDPPASETELPALSFSREKAPRDRTYSDIPLTHNQMKEDGVDVPQVDLDELLLPNSKTLAFSHPLRQGFEHTFLKRYRARSNSDILTRHPQLDLRPTWMRSPRLYKAVIQKMKGNPSPPLFYVEWNILGLRKAVDRKDSVRIVSPKFMPVSSNPAARQMTLGPLRIMIALERIPHEDCIDKHQEHKLRMGIFFTLADDVEVSYRLFHPSFLSESRRHSFRTTPWAGMRGSETGVVTVPVSEVVTVGVAIESLGSGARADCMSRTDSGSTCGWDGGKLPSVSSIMGPETKRVEDLCSGMSICSEKFYARRSLDDLIADAKLPMQQSLSKMSLSSSGTAADKKLFAHIWDDHNFFQ